MDDLIFTQHAKNRISKSDDDGGLVFQHLKKAVRAQLRKSGQWNLLPKYLGCDGATWKRGDSLDELVNCVYLYCFVDGLPGLQTLLNGSDDIEGAVVRKIEWCLLDRQRKANPRGNRIFGNVKSASESLIDRKHAEPVDLPIRGQTVIIAIGKQHPNDREDLPEIFINEVGSVDFVEVVSQNSEAARNRLFDLIVKKFRDKLRGYRVTDLVNLFADAAADPIVISGDELTPRDPQLRKFSDFAEDFRTESGEVRYLNNEAFASSYKALRQHAQSTIRRPRIRNRVLEILDYIANQIEQGERLENLEQAKIARHFGMSTSMLGEDIARLRTMNLDRSQDATEENSDGVTQT